MNFSELDFEALEDIPPLRRHYDVPRISITEKGMVSMNGALKRGVGAQREFRAKTSPDGRYLLLCSEETPNICFSAKGGNVLHLDFKQYLEAKGISLPALYTMEWCQERRAWIGCCQDLPEPPALSALGSAQESPKICGEEEQMKRKKRDFLPRERRLIDGFIKDICRSIGLPQGIRDLHQCAWEAFLSVYRDAPSRSAGTAFRVGKGLTLSFGRPSFRRNETSISGSMSRSPWISR